jgi:phage terminase large subunit
MHVIPANNEVEDGITYMIDQMKKGTVKICAECTNLIKEIERYAWDPKKGLMGRDAPKKENDHAIDALRYALMTHKIVTYDSYLNSHNADEYLKNRFYPNPRKFYFTNFKKTLI